MTIERMASSGVQVLNSYPVVRELPPEVEQFILDGQETINEETCVRINHRDHRKIIVIDGELTIFGGMNIASHYLYEGPFDPAITDDEQGFIQWHDFQVHLRGPVVAELQLAFVERWRSSGGDVIPLDNTLFFPESETEGDVLIRTLRQAPGVHEISTTYYDLIRNAQVEIWIENPYVLHDPLMDALFEAAERGVRVVLIVPGEHQDSALVRTLMTSSFDDWLEAGIELYEYRNRMLHDKIMMVDGRWVTFGSFNLDARSFFHDLEINLLVDSPDFASFIRSALFEVDLGFSTRVQEPPSVPACWPLLAPIRPLS